MTSDTAQCKHLTVMWESQSACFSSERHGIVQCSSMLCLGHTSFSPGRNIQQNCLSPVHQVLKPAVCGKRTQNTNHIGNPIGDALTITHPLLYVRVSAHGAMGHQIDPS